MVITLCQGHVSKDKKEWEKQQDADCIMANGAFREKCANIIIRLNLG